MKKKGNKHCSGSLKDSFCSKFLNYLYRVKQGSDLTNPDKLSPRG